MKLSAPPPPPPPDDGTPGANAPASPDDPNPTPGAHTPGSPPVEASAAPPARPLRWPSWYSGVDAALAGLVLLLAFATASFVARNSDVWLHLAAGKRLLHGDYVPGTDPFSYTGADRAWVNHSWLADAGAYLLYGGEGKVLVVAKALVVILAFGLLLAIRRPQYPLWPWAALAAVAVLASAPYFALRPHVLSILFLSLTLFILFRVPRGANPWRLPIAIGITFWLWANCDAWFILGPLALALLLVGELIQTRLLTPGPEEPAPEGDAEPLGRLPDVATLAKALGVGVLACMLNPHHVRVWELPFELVGAPGAGNDPRLRILLLSVSDETFYGNAGLGYNLNGLAFAALVALGAAALGFGSGRLRASHVALWLGFLLLAIYRVAAIPFFAVVAVPLIAAQLNASSAGAELKSWGDPRSRLLWIGSSLGRVLSLLSLCVLCVLAYPGWLQPEVSNPAYARRVAWGVEPDPLLARAAGQLERWREQEKLPPERRGVIANTELANYVAWFAPREKVFINSHLNHHRPELPDYLRLRRGLGLILVKDEVPAIADVTDVMAKAGAEYLAISDAATDSAGLRTRSVLAANALYGGWRDWAPWYLDGQTVVFGWRPGPSAGGREFAALRVDPLALAFAPDVARVPAPELRPPPAELGWEEAFVRPPRPAPPGVAEALGWFRYRAAPAARMARRQLFREGALWPLGLTQLTVGPAAWLRTAMHAAESRGLLRIPPTDPDAAADEAAMRSIPLLALRAARRAVAEAPDHPEPYFALAEALKDANLPLTESERALGIATAYQQCLARLPRPDRYRKGQYGMSATEVALGLTGVYLGRETTRRVTVQRPGGRPEERDVLVRFTGMLIDLPGLGEFLGEMVVIRPDRSGRPAPARVPLAQFNPNAPSQIVVMGPTLLPLDVAYETLQLAEQYAKVDYAPDGPEETREEAGRRMKAIEAVQKELQNALVDPHQAYDPLKARGMKLPELVEAARGLSLPGEALNLLKGADLTKEYGGPRALYAALLRVGLELALGRLEAASESLNDLSTPEAAAAIEASSFYPALQLLRYQTALQAGEYREAGEIWERMGGRGIGAYDNLPPLGPAVPRQYVLDAVARRYQTQEPEKVLAGLLRPPLLVPVQPVAQPVLLLAQAPERSSPAGPARPGFQSLVLAGWEADWQGLTNLLRQQVASQLQSEASFFQRRGILLLLEGDIPGARRRFEQTTRKPPAGWGLQEVVAPDALNYLRLIEMAERKTANP